MKCGICNKKYIPLEGHQKFENMSITYSVVSGETITEVWTDICPNCKNIIAGALFRCVNTYDDIIKRMNDFVEREK